MIDCRYSTAALKVLPLLIISSQLHASDPGPILFFLVPFVLLAASIPAIAVAAVIVSTTGRWKQLNWAFLMSVLAILPVLLAAATDAMMYVLGLYVLSSLLSAAYILIRPCLVKRALLIAVIFTPPAILLAIVGLILWSSAAASG